MQLVSEEAAPEVGPQYGRDGEEGGQQEGLADRGLDVEERRGHEEPHRPRHDEPGGDVDDRLDGGLQAGLVHDPGIHGSHDFHSVS